MLEGLDFKLKTEGGVKKEHLDRLTDTTLHLFADVVHCCNTRFGHAPTITELIRAAKSKNDLHPLGRAFDLRTRDMEEEEIEELISYIQHRWTYDPERPRYSCVLRHDTGQGDHFHFQTHQNTVQHQEEGKEHSYKQFQVWENQYNNEDGVNIYWNYSHHDTIEQAEEDFTNRLQQAKGEVFIAQLIKVGFGS